MSTARKRPPKYPPGPNIFPNRNRKAGVYGDVSDLAGLEPEQLARHLSHEALMTAASIMRKPGRNAGAQMTAVREILQRGCRPAAPDKPESEQGSTFIVNVTSVAAPASATTVTAVTASPRRISDTN